MDKYTIVACLLVTAALVSFAEGACELKIFQDCAIPGNNCDQYKTYIACLGKALESCTDNNALKDAWKITLERATESYKQGLKCAGERAMPAALLVGLLAFLVNRLF